MSWWELSFHRHKSWFYHTSSLVCWNKTMCVCSLSNDKINNCLFQSKQPFYFLKAIGFHLLLPTNWLTAWQTKIKYNLYFSPWQILTKLDNMSKGDRFETCIMYELNWIIHICLYAILNYHGQKRCIVTFMPVVMFRF